jgi:hypothetical protein
MGARLGHDRRWCVPNTSTPHLDPTLALPDGGGGKRTPIPHKGRGKLMRGDEGCWRFVGATKPAVQEPSKPRVNSNFSPAQGGSAWNGSARNFWDFI